MTCAVSWGRCSLIGFLVVMSFVVVLVLLFISFSVDRMGLGVGIMGILYTTLSMLLF